MARSLNIGIVGGMSPESTVTYYQQIVRCHYAEFGDHSYPRIIIASVSFQRYIEWQHEAMWDRICQELQSEFRAVAKAGADFAILATNTMHKVLPSVESPIPVLSIIDVVSRYATSNGIQSIGLTGTKFTMSDGFYVQGLESRGHTVVVPDASEQEAIHRIIYEELIAGQVSAASVDEFYQIARNLSARGAEAILLGCTELELLTRDNSGQIRFLDSTRLHAEAAWRLSIRGKPEDESPSGR